MFTTLALKYNLSSTPLIAQSFQAKRRKQKINEIQAAKRNNLNNITNEPLRKNDLQSIVNSEGGKTGYLLNPIPAKSKQIVCNSNTNRNSIP